MGKKITRLISFFLSAALFAAALSSCGLKEDSSGKINVRIAYFPNIIHTQALVMKNRGTLEEKWKDVCNVTWTSFNAGPAETEALFAGEIDIGYMGPVPAINANVKSDGDVKIISNATNAGAVLLAGKDAGISSVKDLADKKIAVPQLGNTQHLCLLNLLTEYGLSASDVTITASSNADIVNLIDSGRVDAAVVPEPWGTTMEKNGTAKVISDYNELFLKGDYPSALVIASNDFLKDHPDLAAGFLEAHEEATLFIQEHPEDMQEIVNTEIKAATGKSPDPDVIQSAFSRIKADSTLNTEAIMTFADISKQEGFIRSIPEEEDVFVTEFSP